MKTNLFYKNFIFGVLVILSTNIFGQHKLTKEIRENYFFSNAHTLVLENKYGDIQINGWEKNNIEIIVSIEVHGKSEEKAKERLARVHSKILMTEYEANIKSEILKEEISLFNRYFGDLGSLKSEKSNTRINYTIFLPKQAEVTLNNKYGDIIIADWNGMLKVKVEHGDVHLPDSITNSKLYIKYGKLKATTLFNTEITVTDARLSLGNSNNLILNSDGSEINIEEVEKLELYSNKDNIEIVNLRSVVGTVKYSTIILNNISKEVRLDLNLAELRMLNFKTEAPFINIVQKSSEIYLNISGTSFDFNAKLEEGVLRIPKTMQNIESQMLDKKIKLRHITASYGKLKVGKYVFTGQKGVIILKEL